MVTQALYARAFGAPSTSRYNGAMKRRCRLCRKPVVENSMFCADHHRQAQIFSASFQSSESDEPEARAPRAAPPDVATPSSPGSESANMGLPEVGPGAQPTNEHPRTRRPSTTTSSLRVDEEPYESNDTSREALAYRVVTALEKVRSRAREHVQRDANRWPQISIYLVHNKLLARPYYTIVPVTHDHVHAGPTFAVTDHEVLDALGQGGVVFDDLAKRFEENLEALRSRELQTLDVHLLNYAGVIAINQHFPSQREVNLVAFALQGDAFRRVDLEDVRPRLRHRRW